MRRRITRGRPTVAASLERAWYVETIRAVDNDIATWVWLDMREHGWATDEWPEIFEKVRAADILVLAGPIWLGDNSLVMKRVHERLYGCSIC